MGNSADYCVIADVVRLLCAGGRGATRGMCGVVGLGFCLCGQVAVECILVSIMYSVDALPNQDDVQLRIALVTIQEYVQVHTACAR